MTQKLQCSHLGYGDCSTVLRLQISNRRGAHHCHAGIEKGKVSIFPLVSSSGGRSFDRATNIHEEEEEEGGNATLEGAIEQEGLQSCTWLAARAYRLQR
jgi:hypothetical protein